MKISVGIDIGGTNTVYGVVDKDGKVFYEGSLSTQDYSNVDDFISVLSQAITSQLDQMGDAYELVGIGIGAPNANYYRGTIEHAANLKWQGIVPFVEKMQPFFPMIPIFITNDANAAAIGEMIYGGAKGMKDFIVVTLGTGLGSGIVSGGKLVYGNDGFAGELGHVTVNHTGRMCGCGRKGCLETYVSATGIKRTIFKLMADHIEPSEFRDIPYGELTAQRITEAALGGDPLAIEAYDYTGKVLGRVLANAAAVTSPEAIFLFGGLAKAGKYIFDPTKKYMEQHMFKPLRNKVKLLPSGIDGKNAAVLGASAIVWERLASDPEQLE